MKRITIALLILGISSFEVHAKIETPLKALIEKATELTGIAYVMTKDIDENVEFSKKMILTKKNVEEVLSYVLNKNGYTRFKINENLSSIMRARDIRHQVGHVYKMDKSGKLNVPLTYDYFMLEYEFEHKEKISLVPRSLKSLLSKFGRVSVINNKVMIQETGVNLHAIVNSLKLMDSPVSEEEQERIKEKNDEDFERKIRLEKAKSGCS